MDEMKIKLGSGLMRRLVTKLIEKAIFKNTGYKVNVRINEVSFTHQPNDVASIHISVDADMIGSDFVGLVKKVEDMI